MTQRKDIDYGISIRIADGACVVLQVKSLPTVVGTPCSDVGKGLAVIIFSLLSKGFPFGSAGKESACNAGDLGPIPGLGRSPGEGKGLLQYSGLENSMDCIVLGVAKSQTQLSNFHFHFQALLGCFTLEVVSSRLLLTGACPA